MKVYFGDNQFIGVNHSDGKGLEYLNKYSTPDQIALTLRDAWDSGIRDFCFTVDKKTIDAICLVIDDCPFNLHPALPYAHKINNLISEKGLAGALFSEAKKAGFFSLLLAMIKAILGKYDHAFRILIANEISRIPLKRIKSIGLLNIASDFLLGLKRDDLLYSFYRAVDKGFGKKPLFYTMNFPSMADTLWGSGYNNCTLVFNYNSTGFRTNPSLEVVKHYIKKYQSNESVAMSIFSGSKLDEIRELLIDTPELSGVLFGTSKKTNMISNIQLLVGSQ